MKLGAEDKKKVGLLGGLALVAGYLVYANVLSGPSVPRARPGQAPVAADDGIAPAASTPAETSSRPVPPRSAASRGRDGEFHPVLRSKRPEDRIKPELVDPTLRLDLLAKLQQVELPAAGRNLFQTGPPPKPAAALSGKEPVIALKTEPPKPAAPPVPPGPPPPPPINLKYYGFSAAAGNSTKTAFFLDGEDIFMAKEGETVKRRYRVVRIGVNSVVMEDTEDKHQQTLPLAEEAT
jgi:hypothetical protein